MMGVFGMGIWGMAPAYTNERFPTEVRGVGPGFCYHAAAAIGAMMPFVLGAAAGPGIRARQRDERRDGAVGARGDGHLARP